MNKLRCPICDRVLEGQTPAAGPDFPFCSPRCRLIDLGRWLREDYRIPGRAEGTIAAPDDEAEIP
jgi:endogenous inhibitor of DNA gyrase (YacG/DUF329 family)